MSNLSEFRKDFDILNSGDHGCDLPSRQTVRKRSQGSPQSGGKQFRAENDMSGQFRRERAHDRFDFRQFRQNDYGYISLPVSCMLADGNRLWYGTEGDGLFCYDMQKKTMQNYTIEKGLADNGVVSFEQDKEGRYNNISP